MAGYESGRTVMLHYKRKDRIGAAWNNLFLPLSHPSVRVTTNTTTNWPGKLPCAGSKLSRGAQTVLSHWVLSRWHVKYFLTHFRQWKPLSCPWWSNTIIVKYSYSECTPLMWLSCQSVLLFFRCNCTSVSLLLTTILLFSLTDLFTCHYVQTSHARNFHKYLIFGITILNLNLAFIVHASQPYKTITYKSPENSCFYLKSLRPFVILPINGSHFTSMDPPATSFTLKWRK